MYLAREKPGSLSGVTRQKTPIDNSCSPLTGIRRALVRGDTVTSTLAVLLTPIKTYLIQLLSGLCSLVGGSRSRFGLSMLSPVLGDGIIIPVVEHCNRSRDSAG